MISTAASLALLLVWNSGLLQGDRVEVLQQRLRELSELARRIDSGETTLVEAQTKNQQPDRAMEAIRDQLHRDSGLMPTFLAFIRSEEHSLGARVIALLSITQPTSQDLIVALGKVLEDPPNLHLAQAVFLGFQEGPGPGERVEAWRPEVLRWLTILGCGAGYRPQPDPRDVRGGRIHHGFSFRNAPKGISYHPLLASILTLLEKDKHVSLRYRMTMAAQMIDELHVRGGEQIRFERLVEKFFVEGKEGWRTAMTLLIEGKGVIVDTMEIFGNALARFTPDQRSEVIGEVVRNRPIEAMRPPFRDYLDETVEIIGTESKNTGPNARHASNDSRVLHFLLSQSLDDTWAERLLIKSKSVHLRRTSSYLVLRSCEAGNRFEVSRYSKFLERMVQDPDGTVVGNARAALKKALERKPAVFDDARAEELRSRLK
jgi:hypothetical protein